MNDYAVLRVQGPDDHPEVVMELPEFLRAPLVTAEDHARLSADIPAVRCDVCGLVLEQTMGAKGGMLVEMTVRHSIPFGHPALAGVGLHLPKPVPMHSDEDRRDAVSVCDFCNAMGPTWEYPCGEFTVDITPDWMTTATQDYTSRDEWMACEDCHRDIEADDWAAILPRWMKYNKGTMATAPGVQRKQMRQVQKIMTDGFKAHRTGPPRRVR